MRSKRNTICSSGYAVVPVDADDQTAYPKSTYKLILPADFDNDEIHPMILFEEEIYGFNDGKKWEGNKEEIKFRDFDGKIFSIEQW